MQRRELRAILFLLPILAIVSWLVWQVGRPSAPQSDAGGGMNEVPPAATEVQNSFSSAPQGGDPRSSDNFGAPTPRGGAEELSQKAPQPTLFAFDPNTVSYHDLVRLGFTRGEALGIIKYRERGKVFQIPEDLAACYQVSEAMYRRLEPYIVIGEEFRLRPFAQTRRAEQETISGPPAPLQGAPKDLQSKSNIPTALVDLNSADSTLLVSISGIGALTAGRIIELRERLGGFVRPEQLAEVRGMTEQNFERIVTQIFIDTTLVKKININFAPAQRLAGHPYMRAEVLRKLLSVRQLKGGWRTAQELVEDDIFTEAQLGKLLPYIYFEQLEQ